MDQLFKTILISMISRMTINIMRRQMGIYSQGSDFHLLPRRSVFTRLVLNCFPVFMLLCFIKTELQNKSAEFCLG